VGNDKEPKFWRRRHYRSAELRPAC
jgi:hypothetical protein